MCCCVGNLWLLFVACCPWLLAVWVRVVRCMMCHVCCVGACVLVVCCLLFAVYCLWLCGVCCSLFVVPCAVCVVCCLVCVDFRCNMLFAISWCLLPA